MHIDQARQVGHSLPMPKYSLYFSVRLSWGIPHPFKRFASVKTSKPIAGIFAVCFVGANLNDALLRAVEFLVRREEADPLATHVSMIVLLAASRPDRGVTEPTRILANVRHASGSRVCLFPVGLGLDADFRFLDRLAQQNRGGEALRLTVGTMTSSNDDAGESTSMISGLKSFLGRVSQNKITTTMMIMPLDESTYFA